MLTTYSAELFTTEIEPHIPTPEELEISKHFGRPKSPTQATTAETTGNGSQTSESNDEIVYDNNYDDDVPEPTDRDPADNW